MRKVCFENTFSMEYLDLMVKYKSRIQNFLETYDIIIFMARKAICFYKAMVVNGEIIPNKKCVVLSSRILSYNVINEFKGKKVAIIDDVVVRGKSISYARKIFEDKGVEVDIHFVACEKKFIDQINFKDSIKSPFVYLSDTYIYQLSNFITEYIKASMVPYNVDQPIYKIKCGNAVECEKNFLSRNYFSNITDGLQKKYGIQNLSIHFNPEILKDVLGLDVGVENVYLKIRFMHHIDEYNIIAVPFVLLPELSYKKIDDVFSRLFTNSFDDYISCDIYREEYENKMKILQYILSDLLFSAYSKEYQSLYIEKDMENEFMQFGMEVTRQIHLEKLSEIWDKWEKDDQIKGFDNQFVFDSFLSSTYDYIFDETSLEEQYYDVYGVPHDQKIITFQGLTSYIKRVEGNCDKNTVSSIIDILIDKGILVPFILHSNINSLVRGYKCGEIFNLTKKGGELFAYMLHQYAEAKEGLPIDKVELEKLCVLFFKYAAYRNRLFSVSETFEDDCYSICYSKFGPRVSNCDKRYKVDSRSALVSKLDENGILYLEKEKYKISYASPPKEKKWAVIAENFALSYYYLYKCFLDESVRYSYVHTYNDFLTLLAIGPDKKNQMFSLIAELYLMLRIDTHTSLSEILHEMDHYSVKKKESDRCQYQGIMNGIGSGIWKYSCYCQDDLMDTVFINASKKQRDIRFIKEEYLLGNDENDENPIFVDLLDECGILLYEITYLFNYAQKRYTGEKINKVFKKSAFNNDKFRSMRHGIEKKCEICSEEELVSNFQDLKKRAWSLVNKCDLCIEDAALNTIQTHKNVCVLFDPKHNMRKCGIELNVHSHSENDIIRKCIFLRYDSDKDFTQHLNELHDRYELKENYMLLIFMNMENAYEGIFSSSNTATGDYFKDILRSILRKGNLCSDFTSNKVVICTKKDIHKKDIQCGNFILRYDCMGVVSDGYKFYQYILEKERDYHMENSGFGSITNFNGQIIINGQVGALGNDNKVYQNSNESIITDSFFADIHAMDVELVQDDKESMILIEKIKEDANKKDEKGVLEKLRKLAISVGGSVFAKMVSTTIVEAMKAKGCFPF